MLPWSSVHHHLGYFIFVSTAEELSSMWCKLLCLLEMTAAVSYSNKEVEKFFSISNTPRAQASRTFEFRV